MDNLDLLVLRTVRDWRRRDIACALFTVVRTWGSSPRPVGALMALNCHRMVIGSVSGGCVEDDLLERYASGDVSQAAGLTLREDAHGASFVLYGVSSDEARRFGLPCGGTLELLAEVNPPLQALERLVESIEAGCLIRRTVHVPDGRVGLVATGQTEPFHVNRAVISQTLGPGYRMLLIGAGQTSEYLATIALFSGFGVTVCDPREEYRGSWTVTGASLVHDMPDDAVSAFRPDANSAIIALSHDPKLDDLALIDALGTDAMYVGAIGSRRNDAARRMRLAEHFAVPPIALERLRGPIGMYIGSRTPAEIAVSVMAEVLAVKNGVRMSSLIAVGPAKNYLSRATA